MGKALLNALVLAGVAVGMEPVAWALHKYGMHGFLWTLHADHHRPRGRGLQRNDWFAAFFASLSVALIGIGAGRRRPPFASAGVGLFLYGLGYFLFHDVMFHRRVRRLPLRPTTRYLRRIVRAHRAHHRVSTRDGAISFGFLYAPRTYDTE